MGLPQSSDRTNPIRLEWPVNGCLLCDCKGSTWSEETHGNDEQKGISYLMWQSHREGSKFNKAVWSFCHFSLLIASVYALPIQSFFCSNGDDVAGWNCCGYWNRQSTSFRWRLQSLFLALDIARTVILHRHDVDTDKTFLEIRNLGMTWSSLRVKYNLTMSTDISSDLVSCRASVVHIDKVSLRGLRFAFDHWASVWGKIWPVAVINLCEWHNP